ncbi:hypothetical protein JTB14_020352 [Gonioctena quinquepunctata]|nr:hypothetical protein JTB14_020352 [Gonioctena quinquepunctata]
MDTEKSKADYTKDSEIFQGLKNILQTECGYDIKVKLADELFIKLEVRNVDIMRHLRRMNCISTYYGTMLAEEFVNKLGDTWKIHYKETLPSPVVTEEMELSVPNIEVSNKYQALAEPDKDEQQPPRDPYYKGNQ